MVDLLIKMLTFCVLSVQNFIFNTREKSCGYVVGVENCFYLHLDFVFWDSCIARKNNLLIILITSRKKNIQRIRSLHQLCAVPVKITPIKTKFVKSCVTCRWVSHGPWIYLVHVFWWSPVFISRDVMLKEFISSRRDGSSIASLEIWTIFQLIFSTAVSQRANAIGLA